MTEMTQEQIEEMQKLEQLKKTVLHRILSKEAKERLTRLKLVKPELANQLELYLLQLYQDGQIKTVISDEQIKSVLEALTKKKEFRIRR